MHASVRGFRSPGSAGLLFAVVAVVCGSARAAELEVGPGQRFATIEEAYRAASSGDVVLVHAQRGGKPYTQVALLVKKPRVTFRGIADRAGRRVRLSGVGYDYSGRGSVPRAIFQFDRGADGCVVEGFEMLKAHNDSANGAAVRINQANDVTIRNCDIHDNDMGVMSNGDGTPNAAARQRIENCVIHRNGSRKRPGQNHNLYLGGAGAVVSGCQVYESLTGHNLKSRAHHIRVEYCYIHDSSNREFDLVDATDTSVADSHAVLIGNVIVKAPKCAGNKAVIHFGQDGSHGRDGTLYLVHNTIVTPFISPVVELSSAKASAHLTNNIVWDGGGRRSRMTLVAVRNGADAKNVTGSHNWLSPGLADLSHTSMRPGANIVSRGNRPAFRDISVGDFRIGRRDGEIVDRGLRLSEIDLPDVPGGQGRGFRVKSYTHPAGAVDRHIVGRPDLGAFERVSVAADKVDASGGG